MSTSKHPKQSLVTGRIPPVGSRHEHSALVIFAKALVAQGHGAGLVNEALRLEPESAAQVLAFELDMQAGNTTFVWQPRALDEEPG